LCQHILTTPSEDALRFSFTAKTGEAFFPHGIPRKTRGKFIIPPGVFRSLFFLKKKGIYFSRVFHDISGVARFCPDLPPPGGPPGGAPGVPPGGVPGGARGVPRGPPRGAPRGAPGAPPQGTPWTPPGGTPGAPPGAPPGGANRGKTWRPRKYREKPVKNRSLFFSEKREIFSLGENPRAIMNFPRVFLGIP